MQIPDQQQIRIKFDDYSEVSSDLSVDVGVVRVEQLLHQSVRDRAVGLVHENEELQLTDLL